MMSEVSEPDVTGVEDQTEPMETEEGQSSGMIEESTVLGLDLKRIAEQFAQYLVVDSKNDKQVLDERIEGVVFRVEEFKRQLDWMHQNITSSSKKMQELYEQSQHLKELFQRIDQVEAFLGVVSRNVDVLEECVSKAEKELDPSKLRKVFSSIPKLRKGGIKPDPASSWHPPQVLQVREYFTPPQSQQREPEQSIAVARTQDAQATT